MKISTYDGFIPENVAPYGATKIGVYRKDSDKKVGEFKLQKLRPPTLGEKLYSFGALSDVHLQYTTAQEDFQKALTFLNQDEGVAFTCVCGDLTDNGEGTDLAAYADFVRRYSPDTPVYECTGNHDCQQIRQSNETMRAHTGHDLYYSFTQGADLFIMFGMSGWLSYTGETFSTEALQWLYETLESNRDKRCFVFQHVLRFDGSGKPYDPAMTGELLKCTSGSVFLSLMEHYTNVIWFHGHSHMRFACQTDCDHANYDHLHGCRSIHIPSLAVPREYAEGKYSELYAQSEGYVVDVYKDHLVLRGRDFVAEAFLPIATYCISTAFDAVESGTYKDNTNTIQT